MNQKTLRDIIRQSNEETEKKRVPIKVRLKLYDINDLCELIGVSRSTLMKLRQASGFPKHVKHGNKLYWKINNIKKWLDNNQKKWANAQS